MKGSLNDSEKMTSIVIGREVRTAEQECSRQKLSQESGHQHRSRIRYLSKKNSRILTNFLKLKNFVQNSLNARVKVTVTQQDEQISI